MINWNEILTQVLIVLLPPLAVALSRWAWAKASELFAEIEEMKPQLADFLRQAAYFAVTAAEQAKLGDALIVKKDYALTVAEKYLEENFGLKVDISLLDAAIEKAVWEEFNSDPL